MGEKKYRAALDSSWNEAAFALAENNSILRVEKLEMSGHDASRLAEWIKQTIAAAGITPADVTEWSVGIGPGSFSGLRIGSAFVQGMAYANPNVRVRGISSAVALASAAFTDKMPGHVLTLFDGHRSELLAYGLVLTDKGLIHDGFTAVFSSADQLNALPQDYAMCALERDREAVQKFTDKAVFSGTIDPSALIFNDPQNFGTSPTSLIYLRAAVFVDPKTPRKIV